MLIIDPTIKEQMKAQRLRALETQWFDYYMTKIALEANNRTEEAETAKARMDETEVSYLAIQAIETTIETTPSE